MKSTDWGIIFRLFRRELKSQKKMALFFVLNLILGFSGFLFLQTFQASLLKQTQDKSQQILGGDIVISARRNLKPEEISKALAYLQPIIRQQSIIFDFFAMIKKQNVSRLVMVRAIDDRYPLYGESRIQFHKTNPENKLHSINKLNSENQDREIYVDPDVSLQFQIRNDQENIFKLGEAYFKMKGVIESDPSRTLRFSGLAPMVMISQQHLAATQLIQYGSTMTTQYAFSLKDPQQANSIKNQIEKLIDDPAINISSAFQTEDNVNNVFKYLTDYLGLVSLIAIGLCLVCLVYLQDWLFVLQKKTIAIYKILGLTDSKLFVLQIIKNAFFAAIAFVLSIVALYVLRPFIETALMNYFNLELNLVLSLKQIIFSFLLFLIAPQIISYPAYRQFQLLQPVLLLRDNLGSHSQTDRTPFFWMIFVVLFFWSVAVWQSQSFITGSVFVVVLITAILAARLSIVFLRLILQRFQFDMSSAFGYAIKGLIRKPKMTDLVFTTMTLSVLILTVLPHIKKSIIEELAPTQRSQLPTLFAFDIQPDQLDSFKKIVAKFQGTEPEVTPMVRSRILKINDQSYERVAESGFFQTRESENEARFRNRGVNLTYKSDLQSSEELVEGKWFNKIDLSKDPSDVIPEVSLEEKYADRVHVKVGDVLTFDIQGLELKAKVTSLRRVRWTSFQPNFFIVMQPGFLEEAPQSYLSAMTIREDQKISDLQNQLVDALPNVSIVNVKQTIMTSLKYIDQMALALQVMAFLSLLMGFFIFFILLNTQMNERLIEMNLLQILGASLRYTAKVFQLQFLVLISTSLIVGSVLGVMIASFFLRVIFKLQPAIDQWSLISTTAVIFIMTFIVLKVMSQWLQRVKPLDLLKSQ